MENNERYEVNIGGELIVGEPVTASNRKLLVEQLFTRFGWQYELLEEISQTHYHIRLTNNNLNKSFVFHLFHGNIRKEDPDRNREEKKIQLGSQDPRTVTGEMCIILGFYVHDSQQIEDTVIVAWPVEPNKNYPNNPSLRVNMKNDILPAKNNGIHFDTTTGKRLVSFRPEFIYYYLESYHRFHYEDVEDGDFTPNASPDSVDEATRIEGGTNVLLYGVPGSGKSWTIAHEYCTPSTKVERVVFHPDYTNADFVGQILPIVDPEDKMVTYDFTPGPFTTILREAYLNPTKEYVLVIEEINRGNAPSIFGDIFQLLDRAYEPFTEGGITYKAGTSAYGITNKSVAKVVYEDETAKVRIPSNLSIYGTMNTSDQNVFTLDTAFQRRWRMRLIENNFDNVRASLANAQILDTGVVWSKFCDIINAQIIGNKGKVASAEDKRLGVYFIHESDLEFDARAVPSDGYTELYREYIDLLNAERDKNITTVQAQRLRELRAAIIKVRVFPEKVIKYLWDDAFKFNPEAIFDTENMDCLEKVIRTFVFNTGSDRLKVFKQHIRNLLNGN